LAFLNEIFLNHALFFSSMNTVITQEQLDKYFAVTGKALEKARRAFDEQRREQAEDFFDMASRYYKDAQYFLYEKGDAVLAFAALNYAHGWLDAGARIKLFTVDDDTLFTIAHK
jgi:hypothetical protein